MSLDDKHLKELYYLLEALRENVITCEQFKRLDCLICSNRDVCELYVGYMQFCSDLHHFYYAHTPVKEFDMQPISDSAILDYSVWQELAEDEKTAVAVEVEKQIEVSVEPRLGLMKVEKPKRTISRFSLYTLILSTAAVLLLMVMILMSPVRPIVATLTDSINAEWINIKEIPANGNPLRQGGLTLAKGLAEITFDNGAVVVVEGPAVFELESSKSMFVINGKISAVVSEYATGFTVNTLCASIVDLGTEFGVNVEDDGSCELHMFTGKASLVTGKKDAKKISQLVTSQQARLVDGYTGQVSNIKMQKKKFVRVVDSKNNYIWRGEGIDLADIAVGGDGHGTGNHNKGIYPVSGKLKEIIWEVDGTEASGFVQVDSLSRVDGVFVPDGGSDAVQVTSQGHTCDQFGDTNGRFHKSIFHGDAVTHNGTLIRKVIIGGQEIRGSNGPALVLHSNLGITFDLDAIRAALPMFEVTGFEGACGLVDDSLATAKADFWVLVDGQVRFKSKDAIPGNGSSSISVELSKTDRFLTLAISDAGGDIGGDWGVFVKPVLELKLSQQ